MPNAPFAHFATIPYDVYRYNRFCERLPATQLKTEIERCHQEHIEKLDKPERWLVLHIVDSKDRTTENLSVDSFIPGVCLAWKLNREHKLSSPTSFETRKQRNLDRMPQIALLRCFISA